MYSNTTTNLSSGAGAGLEASPLATQLCQLTKLFEQLQAEVRFLSSRVSQVESENLSLRLML
jgi:hypothetical protein